MTPRQRRTMNIKMVNTLKELAKIVRNAMTEDARAEEEEGRED